MDTALNSGQFKLGRHPRGHCNHCNEEGNIDHIVKKCPLHRRKRNMMKMDIEENNVNIDLNITLSIRVGDKRLKALIMFLRETGLYNRI